MMRPAGSLVDTIVGSAVTVLMLGLSWSAIRTTSAAADRIVHRSHAIAEVSRLAAVADQWCARVGWPDHGEPVRLTETSGGLRLGHLDGVPQRELVVSWSAAGIRIGNDATFEEFPRLRMREAQLVVAPFPALRLVVDDGRATWPIVAPLAAATHGRPAAGPMRRASR